MKEKKETLITENDPLIDSLIECLIDIGRHGRNEKRINDKLTSNYTAINVEKEKETLITINGSLIDSLIGCLINIEILKTFNSTLSTDSKL